MNRNRLFWGIIVILLGVMLLMNTLGVLTVNAWKIFWPFLLVMVGCWMLLGPVFFKRKMEPLNISIPRGNASGLKVKIKHGAGRLHIGPSAAGCPDAVTGTIVGGVDYENEMNGGELKVRLKAPSDFFWGFPPVSGFEGFSWDVNLNRDLPLRLVVQSGANEARLDLRDLKVTELKIETGASANQIILPAAAGFTTGSIQCGASSVQIQVPEGVAGRFEIKHGLAGIHVDTTRFINNNGVYETPGFDTAANRIQCSIETGVGSVEIR